jgi:predicted amidohydrolase YtcJ
MHTILRCHILIVCGILLYPQGRTPDYVLLNGKIFTASSAPSFAQALAIKGERIMAVGCTDQISKLGSASTVRLDLGGRVVIPGINDAHYHFGPSPEMHQLALNGQEPSWEDVKRQIASAVASTPKGTIIHGSTGVAVFENQDANRATLDRLAPEHPVLLSGWTGHYSIFNSQFMKLVSIQESEADSHAGGGVSGRVMEYANFRMEQTLAQSVSEAQALQQAKKFFDQAMRYGVTSVQTMAARSPDQMAALLRKAESPIRIRLINLSLGRPGGVAQPQERSRGKVAISGLKWIGDGTPIEWSAALRAPYTDNLKTSGQENFSEQDMEAMLGESLRSGDQLLVHLVGDRAVEDFLEAMTATGGPAVWSRRRVRIEHGDELMPDLIPKAKELGVIVVQNPSHFTIGELLAKRYGPERAAHSQPFRSLMEAGVALAIGSDGPLNPYLNIMLASNDPSRPHESLTREQAVTAYTQTSAYAEFAEKDKGRLEPGKLADLAVLSQDIFQVAPPLLPVTESVLTMVGGKIVYNHLSK